MDRDFLEIPPAQPSTRIIKKMQAIKTACFRVMFFPSVNIWVGEFFKTTAIFKDIGDKLPDPS
jgi:hypothetical protein